MPRRNMSKLVSKPPGRLGSDEGIDQEKRILFQSRGVYGKWAFLLERWTL